MLELAKIGSNGLIQDDEETSSFLQKEDSTSAVQVRLKRNFSSFSKRAVIFITIGALLLVTFAAIHFSIELRGLSANSNQEDASHVIQNSDHQQQAADVPLSVTAVEQSAGKKQYSRDDIRQQQIKNYLSGNALLVNFHITHHAGTSLCHWAKVNGPVPSFACMGGDNIPASLKHGIDRKYSPWTFNETDYYVPVIRQHFHYISWDWGVIKLPGSLNETHWEHPNLISIIVLRHPLDRLLSDVGGHDVPNGTMEEWWEYANDPIWTNNFALRTIVSKEGCCEGAETSKDYLETAKSYLDRFTIILDQECFGESLQALSSTLNLKYDPESFATITQKSARERINNDTVYEYLRNRNAKDIELYEWAKNRSLVVCNSTNVSKIDAQEVGDRVLSELPTHKQIQVKNYKDGKALMLDFHITHHAGTALCTWARMNGPVPSFACMGGENIPPDMIAATSLGGTPWLSNETEYWVEKIRPTFHYISWEYGLKELRRSVNDTNWEHPRLLSVIVMRNPLDRLLSDVGSHHIKEGKHGSTSEWWLYANDVRTDNFALRTITSKEGCCKGPDTSAEYVEMAKSHLSRFTFIIDQDCFGDSLEVLSSILNLRYNATATSHRKRKPAKERMKTGALYDYLKKRNTRDIELYEWARTKALVQCQERSLI